MQVEPSAASAPLDELLAAPGADSEASFGDALESAIQRDGPNALPEQHATRDGVGVDRSTDGASETQGEASALMAMIEPLRSAPPAQQLAQQQLSQQLTAEADVHSAAPLEGRQAPADLQQLAPPPTGTPVALGTGAGPEGSAAPAPIPQPAQGGDSAVNPAANVAASTVAAESAGAVRDPRARAEAGPARADRASPQRAAGSPPADGAGSERAAAADAREAESQNRSNLDQRAIEAPASSTTARTNADGGAAPGPGLLVGGVSQAGTVAGPRVAAPAMNVPQPVETLPGHIQLLSSQGGGTARVRLHPAELGEVEITVRVRGANVDVTIHADQPSAQLAVLATREQLVDALGARDFRIGSFEVSEARDPNLAGGSSFRDAPDQNLNQGLNQGFDPEHRRASAGEAPFSAAQASTAPSTSLSNSLSTSLSIDGRSASRIDLRI